MPIDPSISLSAQVPNAMTTIGNMLNIGNQQVALQRAQQTLPYDVQAAQANAQGATANANVATQTQQPREAAAAATALSAQQQAAQEKLKTLTMHVSNGAANLLMLYGKGASPQDVAKVITDTMTNAGAPPAAIQQALAQLPTDPSQIDNFIVNKAQSAMGLVAQIGSKLPAPTFVNTGSTALPVASGNAAATGVKPGTPQGPATTLTLGPDQRQTAGTDARGNPIVTTKDANGAVVSVAGAPVQGASAPVPPQVIPPTETPQSYAALQQNRNAVNQAAAQVPDEHYNNRQVIDILDSTKGNWLSPTGPNAQTLANLSGAIGVPLSGDFATDANKISHFLALQTQSNEKAMGVSTDAGRITSATAMGSIKQTPASLRTAVAVNDAGVSGLQFYNQGQEAAVKAGGIPAIRAFKNQWSQNYDPNAMRLYNAGKNNDPEEIKEVAQSLKAWNPKTNSVNTSAPQFKAMLQKAANIEKLTQQGHL